MGEVFKAYDDRLDRWVAIKRIRPGKEDTDENRSRFRREARATAQLNHPAIVHVYDIFQDGDSDCIVMEYIEGRSLHSMTSEGALDPTVAARLGQEIAEGLAVAHEKQILHRDLKTENIIITPDGHAKILDFGLAKPLIESGDLDSELTGKGQLVGTSRAMSPEYVGGEEVDHRSDLFSLGVLLYEAVTGHSPFKAQNTLATLKQVIIHQQPPTREMNPEVPAELSDLIDQLLEKDPADRPQAARIVAEDLSRLTGQVSSGAISRASFSATPTLSNSLDEDWSISKTIIDPKLRPYWIGLVAVVIAALVGAYILGSQNRGERVTGTLEDPVPVVLGDFQNKTGEAILDDSLNTAFRVSLEQSPYAKLLPESQIEEALMRMERAPDTVIDQEVGVEICQRENAKALVIGQIIKVGSTYSLSARIISPSNEESLYTTPAIIAENQGAILSRMEELAQAIRTNLGETLASINETNLALDKVTTRNLEALKAYSLGSTMINDDTNRERGISLLTQAVALDQGFAMAHVRLAIVHFDSGRSEKALHHFQEAQANLERLSSFERLYVQGWMSNRRGSTDEMLNAWSVMTTLYSERVIGHYNLGMTLWHFKNDFNGAVEKLSTAAELEGGEELAAKALGYCLLGQGNADQAIDVFKKFDNLSGLQDSYITAKRPEILEHLTQGELSASRTVNVHSSHRRVLLYGDQGSYQEALNLARQIKEQATTLGMATDMLHSTMAMITYTERLGNDEPLAELLHEASRLVQEELDLKIEDRLQSPVLYLMLVAKISARNGQTELAKKLIDTYQGIIERSSVDLWTSYLTIARAELLAAQEQPSAAIDLLENANSMVHSLQSYESLARLYEMSGDYPKAIEASLWLYENRGRIFAECLNICHAQDQSLMVWHEALERLARLYERENNIEEATRFYQAIADHWYENDSQILQTANKKLNQFRPE